MRSFLIATMLVALLAGCASPSAITDPDANDSVQTASVAQEMPNATTLDANASLVPVRVPYTFDGRIPAYVEACAWTPAFGMCQDSPSDFSKIRDAPVLPGAPTGATITATWTSAAPTNDQMVLTIFSYDQKGHFKSYGYVVGPSPLKFTPKSIAVPEGQKLIVGLFPQDVAQAGTPVGGRAGGTPVEQPYKLDGFWLVQPSSSAT